MNNYEMLDDFNCKVNCCKEKNRNNINELRSFSVSIYLYLCDVEDHYIFKFNNLFLIIYLLHSYTIKNVNVLEI